MKKVIVITNDADATGNTTLTTILSAYLQRKETRHRIVLTSAEQELPINTVLIDVEDGFKPEELVNLIDSTEAVIVDVHTGGAERFEKLFFKHRIDEVLDEIECGVTVVLPVCDDELVIQSALERARAFHKCAEFLVVKMPLLADEPLAWSGSAAQRTLQQFGAVEVSMGEVPESILDDLDAMELDVPLALTQRHHLARYVRHQLLEWEVTFCENLRAVEQLFIPARSRAEDTRADAIFGRTLAYH